MFEIIVNSLLTMTALLIIFFVHEFGHYLIARMFNVKIAEFSIGIGPVKFLPKFVDKRGTVWRLGLLPIGAYVRPLRKESEEVTDQDERGEDFFELILNKIAGLFSFIFSPLTRLCSYIYDPADETKVLGKKYVDTISPFKRFILAVAGPISNFIFSTMALCILYSFLGRNLVELEVVKPYETMQVGDRIISVNGKQCSTLLKNYLFNSQGDLCVKRLNETIVIKNITVNPMNTKIVGENRQILSLTDSITFAIHDISRVILNYINKFLDIRKVIPKLGGTVSVLKEGLEAISKGGIIFITWVILISTVLGVFNLLPIPPLDGGLMLLSVVQMVAPKKYHRDIEVLFGYFGLVFVMFLFVIFVKSDGKIIKGLFSR